MAGKMNSQVLASAILNFDSAEKALKVMEESYGSSANEMEKYTDSLAYKINAFKETLVGIAQSTITRDFLKNLVDDATTMLETFENFGTVLKPLYNLLGNGVSIIANLSTAFGGLDKVIAGLAIFKTGSFFSKSIFGADILKFTQDVDTLRPKLQILGRDFTSLFAKVNQKVDYTSLRKLVVELQNGSVNAEQLDKSIAKFNAGLTGANASTLREAQAVKQLNRDFQQGLITEQAYKNGLDQISRSLALAQAETTQLTAKTRIMQGVMKLANGAKNGIIGILSTLVFSKVFEEITKLIEKNEKLAETAKETAQTFKSENESLETLKEKYISVLESETSEEEKNKELAEIKNTLIDKYKIEESQLKNLNTEREKTIDLLNQEQRANRDSWLNDNYETIVKANDTIFNRDMSALSEIASINVSDSSNIIESVLDLMKVENNDGYDTLKVQSDNLIDFYDTYNDIAGKLSSKKLTTGLTENEEALLQRANDVVNNYKKDIEEYRDIIETETSFASANFFEDFLNVDGNSLDKVNNANVQRWLNSLEKSLNNANFNDLTKQAVKDLAENALNEANIVFEISPKFSYDKQAVEDVTEKINNMFYSYDKDGNVEGSIIDKVEKFNKAMQDIGKNGFIDKNAYDELTKIYPQIADIFEQTEDGYTASLLNIQSYTEQFLNENSQLFDEAKDVLIRETANVNDEIAKIDKQIWEARVNGGYDNRYIIEQLYDERDALISQRDVLDETKNGFDEMANSMQLAEDKNFSEYIDANTSAINNMSSSMKLLSNAYKEINNDGTVSIDTLLSLIDNGYATAICYDSQTGAITLNRKELEFLTKVKIETAIAELEQAKATAENTAEIEAQIIAYKELENHLGDVFKGEFNSGSNSSSSSSSTTPTTESEQEKLAKTLKERLENEKKGIEAVNKEREKSIELIKAYNELNNAKNNKTIRSYSEERGWEYVTDQKAILESKQNLDKLIADYKNSMIDEQISAIDNMSLQALRNAVNRPVEIPTNSDIMKDIQKNVIENIQNNTHTSNTNKNNYTINIGNINTDNAEQFLSELNDILKNGGLESYIGL